VVLDHPRTTVRGIQPLVFGKRVALEPMPHLVLLTDEDELSCGDRV